MSDMTNIDFPSLVADGNAGPDFYALTPNGVSMHKGPGWNRQYQGIPPQVPRTGVWGEADINIAGRLMPGPQGNRTGE